MNLQDLLCIEPWNIYASEWKYITTVLMKNLSVECVLVWKFTLTLCNIQFYSPCPPPMCCGWLHWNMQSREVASDKKQFWKICVILFLCSRSSVAVCYCSVLCHTLFFHLRSSCLVMYLNRFYLMKFCHFFFQWQTLLISFLSFIINRWTETVLTCVCVFRGVLLSGPALESAHWPFTVDVVTMVKVAASYHPIPPYSCCYVTASFFSFHLSVITQGNVTPPSFYLLTYCPNHVDKWQ